MARFNENRFSDAVYFANASFNGIIDFQSTTFSNIVDFSFINLDTEADFNFIGTKLPALIDFSYVKNIGNPIDFLSADYSRNIYNPQSEDLHYINLFNSDIAKIKIDYQHFRLCFYNPQGYEDNLARNFHLLPDGSLIYGKDSANRYDDAETDTLLFEKLTKITDIKSYLEKVFPQTDLNDKVVKVFTLHWINAIQYDNGHFPKALSDDEIIAVYEKLLKSFNDEGLKISYQNLDVEYKNFLSACPFLQNWNLYGYKKALIFRNTAIILLMFTLITLVFYNKLNKPIKPENDTAPGVYYIEDIPTDISWKQIYRRLWYSLIYTSTVFFLLNLELKNLNFKKISILYIFWVYATGILCLGYIADFVLQK